MHRFPDDTIRLGDVILRPLTEDDSCDVTAACNDDTIRAWLPLPVPYSADDARHFITEHAPSVLDQGKGIERAIVAGGRLCGVIGLSSTHWAARSTEAGYWLAPWGRGRGLATLALTGLTAWAFAHQIDRVSVQVATRNHASLAVALRSGFSLEGTLRRAGVTHDGAVDLHMLSRLVDDPPF